MHAQDKRQYKIKNKAKQNKNPKKSKQTNKINQKQKIIAPTIVFIH
jgi:hypothetical protein